MNINSDHVLNIIYILIVIQCLFLRETERHTCILNIYGKTQRKRERDSDRDRDRKTESEREIDRLTRQNIQTRSIQRTQTPPRL